MMCAAPCSCGPDVECSVAGRPMTGQSVSGDTFVCQPCDGGTLVGVIDGLGHGEEAAVASSLAKRIMEEYASEELAALIERCNSEMRQTRGAVASLARFDTESGTLSLLGVGNVDGILFRHCDDGGVKRESMALRGGVIGYMLPPLRVWTGELHDGDTLVLATDGLSGAFGEDIDHGAELDAIVDRLLKDYGKTGDDALVLAVRYTGGAA